MTDAGRIGFLVKGAYSASAAYEFLDVVFYGNSSYVAKKATVGNAPAENNEFWQILARGVNATVSGVKGSAETAYRTGNVNITPANLGITVVNNTADANKPVSTAQQEALNAKINKAGDTMTGNLTVSPASNEAQVNVTRGERTGRIVVSTQDNFGLYDTSFKKWLVKSNAEGGVTLNGTATQAMQDGNGKNIAGTYAKKSIYDDSAVNMGRKNGTTVGDKSFAFGIDVEASGAYSFAEGGTTIASGDRSHAEGDQAQATSYNTHAEGYKSVASKNNSHAEGSQSNASGLNSHAEGNLTEASGESSHAQGRRTLASGKYTFVGGWNSEAASDTCFAHGFNVSARNDNSMVTGHFNAAMTGGGSGGNKTGSAFVIGNGTGSSALSNAFSVMFDGTVKSAGTFTASTAADYAEMFEKLFTGLDDEDIVGRFVTMEGNKIRLANQEDDYILGIVSGNPFVLGNGDCDTWNGMFLRDDFGRLIMEPAPKIEYDEETGEEKEVFDLAGNPVYEGERPALNPEYDSSQPYISRMDRPEWEPIGMLGVLPVVQDGTLVENGYCMCGENGIATACCLPGCGYRVTEVINDRVAKVIFREALPVSVGRKLQQLVDSMA